MNLATIAWKSMRQRAVASSLTALSVALGIMLMVSVLVIHRIVDDTFSQNSVGYDLIVGPKGSDLQLVLSTVYRIQPPIENLPYRFYKDLKDPAKYPSVVDAVPIALGDTTEEGNFPIVGTTRQYFLLPYAQDGNGEDRKFLIRGDGFAKRYDAVIGARVARENGWDVGSQFKLIHGGQESHVHDELFTVRGVIAPTGTPNDKSVFVNIEGLYFLSGHDKPLAEAYLREKEFYGEPVDEDVLKDLQAKDAKERALIASGKPHHHSSVPDLQKEVTAVLVNMRTQIAAALFSSKFKSGFQAQAVNPIIPMKRIKDEFVGHFKTILLVLTGLVVVVSGIGIFVSIYNSMADRRRELAIMRALGAQRRTVFSVILAESALLCIGGGLLGFALGHALIYFASPWVERATGLLIDPWMFNREELYILPGLVLLATLVGFIPAIAAYRTDVARSLTD